MIDPARSPSSDNICIPVYYRKENLVRNVETHDIL